MRARRRHWFRRRIRSERGDLPATLLLLPVLALMAEFLVFTGRVSNTYADINAAAAEAARAGSLSANPADALAVLEPAAKAVIEQRGVPCTNVKVDPIDPGQIVQGGLVAVRVTCTITVADLGLFSALLPGEKTFDLARSSFEAIDVLRKFD